MTDLTAVSLFAGVGGFDLAMERNGINVVATVEIDKNARGVLQHQFPNTQHFTDVTTVTGEDLRNAGFIPERGIITGGFPCQDLSVAGKRAGLVGARSGLFYEIARIADETKAKWLVLENVPGLLSSQRGADMGAVVGTLVELGYGVAWRVLDAQHFGVPQRRRRVFIVAERAGDPARCAKVLFERTSVQGDTSQGRTPREEVAGDVGESPSSGLLSVERVFGQTGFAKYSENEVTTLSATTYKRAEDNVVVREVQTVRRLTPTECERLQGFPDGWTAERIDEVKGLVTQADSSRYKQMGNAVAVPCVEWIVNRLVEIDRDR